MKNLNDAIDERIDEIMDEFDFDKVWTVMKTLNWGWGMPSKIPDIHQMKQSALRLLKSCAACSDLDHTFTATGGFYATFSKKVCPDEGPWFRLDLAFHVEDSCCSDGISYKPSHRKTVIKIRP